MFWQFVSSLDLLLFHVVNGRAGNWLFDNLVNAIAGNLLISGTIFIAPYWYYWFRKGTTAADTVAVRHSVGAGLIGGILSIVISRAMAESLPFRDRPMHDFSSGFVAPAGDFVIHMEHWSAFPSDTAAFTVALAFGLYRLAPRLSLVLVAYAVAISGLGRIYFGIHYPSDVGAGMVIGILSALIAHNRLSMRLMDRTLRWEAAAPGPFYLVAILATTEMGRMFDNVRRIGRGAAQLIRQRPEQGWLLFSALAMCAACALIVFLRTKRRRSRLELITSPTEEPGCEPAHPTVHGVHRRSARL
jgi:undecaprenyl-diphosphatase